MNWEKETDPEVQLMISSSLLSEHFLEMLQAVTASLGVPLPLLLQAISGSN